MYKNIIIVLMLFVLLIWIANVYRKQKKPNEETKQIWNKMDKKMELLRKKREGKR